MTRMVTNVPKLLSKSELPEWSLFRRKVSIEQGFAPFLQERRVYKNPPYGKPNFAVLVAARFCILF